MLESKIFWYQDAVHEQHLQSQLIDAKQKLALDQIHELAARREKRAEEAGLRGSQHHTDGELFTLHCSPFSSANQSFPAGVEAALRELEAVVAGAVTRRPRFSICETTSGLWRHKEITRRYEYILGSSGLWDWEAMLTSPHAHGGKRIRRWRVYYVGILHELVRGVAAVPPRG